MKKAMLVTIMLVLFASTVMAAGGLDSFLSNLNIQARADMQGFSVKLSAQFGVPLPQVQAVITTASAPADAFMCFQLGYMTQTSYEKVVQVYQGNRGKGWGVIAKSLGIKPGSPEFHALKRGDFVFNGEPMEARSKGNGKGKGKGHNK
jgi:hypothetical protein